MAEHQGESSRREINKAEIVVSYSLRVGVLLSATVILAGLIRFFITGESGYIGHSYPTQISDIIAGAFAFKPFGVIMMGLVLLILTPVMRVGVSILVFITEKDWLYVGISAIVFLILSSSFFFGK
jgi:uncharacterized membrane protein